MAIAHELQHSLHSQNLTADPKSRDVIGQLPPCMKVLNFGAVHYLVGVTDFSHTRDLEVTTVLLSRVVYMTLLTP